MILKKDFYFIRHGQTDFNASGDKEDYLDISLNQTGFKQAHTVEPIVASLYVKSICCSPLKRAKETKEVISSRLKATHYEIAELSECCLKIWTDVTGSGVSAYEKAGTHVKSFMDQAVKGINQALACEGPVLVVAHGGIHWAMCCLMEIADHSWVIDNCLPIHFTIGTDGKWKARKLV